VGNGMNINKGDLLTEQQLDDAVHELVRHALELGNIPIAGIMSERAPDGRHKVVGFGWNRLREGIPGIHGETGAIMNMGRLPQGYAHLTATSSLSPCPFCQASLALHLGVKEIRVLDVTNYKPDFSGYAKLGLSPIIAEHRGIIGTFGEWVRDPANQTIWNRDIGEWSEPVEAPFDVASSKDRTDALLFLAHREAEKSELSGEAPVGAVIADRFGEVIGAGHARIKTDNDPSAVAAMSAWRACGARDHWRDKTLVLTAGPDHIAYSMFRVFRFGQLVVASTDAFAGEVEAVRALAVPVHIAGDRRSGARVTDFLRSAGVEAAREYLGAKFNG
jgi:tRNA(Arg) A34 adenosine deaminase TadA